MGRPTKYKPEYDEQATKLCLLGATNQDLAKFFNVADTIIDRWLKLHDSFSGAVKAGREDADSEVVQRLYARTAIDTTACIFWLKNRQRANWREKYDHEVTGKDGKPIEVKVVPEAIMEMIKGGDDENGA